MNKALNDDCLQVLASNHTKFQALSVLGLESSPNITEKGLMYLVDKNGLVLSKLQRLILDDTNISLDKLNPRIAEIFEQLMEQEFI